MKEYKNKDTKVIATSNVTQTQGTFEYVLNNSSLLDLEGSVLDHSFVMLLKALIKVNVKTVHCAGFDGYLEDGDNYFNPAMEYWFSRRKAKEFNEYVIAALEELKKEIRIEFVTDSFYVR